MNLLLLKPPVYVAPSKFACVRIDGKHCKLAGN